MSADADSPPESTERTWRVTHPDDAEAPFEARIGLEAAQRRLGDALPTGRGVVMGHVEGERGRYMPNPNDRRFERMRLEARSGPSEPFNHATHTARIIYGPGGLAPGVKHVHHFAVDHWITSGYLQAGRPSPPHDDAPRVWSHSWISQGEREQTEAPRLAHVLRRVDHAIDAQGTIMCVGVNNRRGSVVPAMLASAYNAIAVGAAEGASSGGYTRIETAGRCKPDLIAPRSRTSYSTPVVAALAARLVEAAERVGQRHEAPYASRPEVIKAALMAGAVKPWNWRPEPGKPLDEHLGAGWVHLDRALEILHAGPQPIDEPGSAIGWSYREMASDETDAFHFEVTAQANEISILLTWHRRIDGGLMAHPFTGNTLHWNDAPRMANLDLRLHYTDAQDRTGVIGRSTSDIDNVQHIHITDPPPGRYRLDVTRRPDDYDETWTYAVAWRVSSAENENEQ